MTPFYADILGLHDGSSSGANSGASEGDRALFQDRVRVFAKALCLVVLGTYPMGIVELRASYGLTAREIAGHPLHMQVAFGLGAAIFWRLLATRPRSSRFIAAIDAAVVLGFATTWIAAVSWVIFAYPEKSTSGQVDTGSVIHVVTLLVVTRAAIIPSTSRRTAALSALAFVPGLALAWVRVRSPAFATPQPPLLRVVGQAALSVIAAALVTQVIYRLRRQVRAAMALGQYTLEEKIGEGGMGVVYRARHGMLRRRTAIKLLRPDRSGLASIQRFEREVRLASMLTHPNTVAIYDYGRTPDGFFYYAMELLDGIDLQRLVELDGPQRPERVAHVLTQVCGALQEAHDAGLVHRDIKPANILVCRRGGVFDVAKVVDFGLVKSLGEDSSISSTGLIAGTPLYLSPEAITAPDEVDAKSDLYALGAVGYFMLTGKPMFEGHAVLALCAHHIETVPEPPSRRLGRAIPADLERVLLQCLEKNPRARPASARAVALSLAPVHGWTQTDGAAWWERHGQVLDRRSAPASACEATVQINVADRQRGTTT
jgi:eukaryotic-like serine/threonine-protein kinase